MPGIDPYSYAPLLSNLDPSVLQGAFIFLGVFAIAVLIGLSRRYIASSSMQGLWAGAVTGIIAVLAIEAGLVWGLRNFMAGDRADILPKNIKTILTSGQENLTQVLGIQTEREIPTAQGVISDYGALSPLDTELVKSYVCKLEEKEGND